MNRYDYCQLVENEDSSYCHLVNLEGKLPDNLNIIYDISYLIYFTCILAVVFSPFYLVYKLIGGLKHD